MNQSVFLKTALDAAKRSEKIIMKYFSEGVESSLKKDRTPVTHGDVEAESIIIETIKKKFPDHGFLGEELGTSEPESEYIWIIDPIDGTKNYMRRIPLFATQIALMKNDKPILGVSNAPALKELMYAEQGKGSFLNGKSVRVTSTKDLEKSYMSFGGLKYFEHSGLIPNLLSLVNSTQGHRGFGDFWGYHLVAQGKIDIMLEVHTTAWDITALRLIVEEAGGTITNLNGEDIVVKDSTSVLATNGVLHNSVLKYF